MNLTRQQARFLIAARSFLCKVKLAKPQVNIYDYEVPKDEIVNISKLTTEEAEEVSKSLERSGLIHVMICNGKFDYCKVASLSFDILDGYLAAICKK